MHQIRIGGEAAEFLALTIHRRRLPQSADYWDGNWLDCDVEVAVGAFHGAFGGMIRNEDLERFRSQLTRLHDELLGTATLEALEGWLCLICQATGGDIWKRWVNCAMTRSPGIRWSSASTSIKLTFRLLSGGWTRSAEHTP